MNRLASSVTVLLVVACSTGKLALTGTFVVLHEYPLEFEGYLLSCAEIPGAKESDPD